MKAVQIQRKQLGLKRCGNSLFLLCLPHEAASLLSHSRLLSGPGQASAEGPTPVTNHHATTAHSNTPSASTPFCMLHKEITVFLFLLLLPLIHTYLHNQK